VSDLHVVFGTGPLGLAVMCELRRRGRRVRMINRSSRFEKAFGAQATPLDEAFRATLDWYRRPNS
jgi:NADPH-dependent 2,4-dienoyl-CoA reductase/sulfur reductase-like enzyme